MPESPPDTDDEEPYDLDLPVRRRRGQRAPAMILAGMVVAIVVFIGMAALAIRAGRSNPATDTAQAEAVQSPTAAGAPKTPNDTGGQLPAASTTPKLKAPDKDGYDPKTEFFSSAEGAFRVKFPEQPKVLGKTVTCSSRTHRYSVEYFDRFAPEYRDKRPEAILDSLQATLERKWGTFEVEKEAKIIAADRWLSYVPKSSTDTLTIGDGGTRFTYRQGTNIGLYITPKRIYVVTAYSQPYSVGGETSTLFLHAIFLRSFQPLDVAEIPLGSNSASRVPNLDKPGGMDESPEAIERKVKVLIADLDSKDAKVRMDAVKALGNYGPKAAAAVDRLILVWRRIDGPRITDLNRKRDREENIEEAAKEALSAIGKPAVPALVKLLNGDEYHDMFDAVWILAGMGPEAVDAVKPLIRILEQRNTVLMKKSAIYALGAIGPGAKAAKSVLMAALNDPDNEVRTRAAEALKKIEGN